MGDMKEFRMVVYEDHYHPNGVEKEQETIFMCKVRAKDRASALTELKRYMGDDR